MNTVQGFCDFNILAESHPLTTLKEVAIQAIKLGYSAIAVNTVLDEEYLKPAKKKQKGKNEYSSATAEEKKEIPPPPTLNFSEEELSSHKIHGKSVKILKRLTVILSEPGNTTKLVQSPHTKKYDLLAVCPVTSAAFQHAVGNMDVDIITYDPQLVKDVRFNRRQYRQAVDRGIYFEIPYAYMLRDSTSRKKLIQMTHWYHSIGKSRNIVLSSGASTPQEIRGPYDVANMGLLFGLSEGESRAALNLSGRSIALHAVTRKTGKCVSYVTETEKLEPIDQWKVRELQSAEEKMFKEDETTEEGEPEPKKARTEAESMT